MELKLCPHGFTEKNLVIGTNQCSCCRKDLNEQEVTSGMCSNCYIRVDIGCGQNKKEGFIGVDIADIEGVDIVHDLNIYPYPIKDNSVSEIFISHYIEHTHDIMKFMHELHRILKVGGRVDIIAPYYNSVRCWQDPTHRWAISEASFYYYNKEWRKANKLDHYPITCDFDFHVSGYMLFPEWQSRSEEAKMFAIKHYTNVIMDMQVLLTKREPSK